MFQKISHKIALQFTVFVFLLFLVNGGIFLAADFSNARRQSHQRLSRTLHLIVERAGIQGLSQTLLPFERERVRIVDALGNPLYSGGFFAEISFVPHEGFSYVTRDDELYSMVTAPIVQGNQVIGYIQVADVERFQERDLPLRILLFLLVSVAISALTFFIGLYFARRSLRPAEAMVRQLEQFTQDASHELRTPLAVLNSSLDLALKTKKYQEGIASAKDDVKQISVLVERLLELARMDTFTIERHTFDFSSLVGQAVEKQRAADEKKAISVEADIKQGVHVEGDAVLLRQVLSNLLSNAVKFNKKNGKIVVHMTKEELSVKDTGIGIAKDALPHIFDRFYQADTSRAKEGFGLGLAMVKRIVELHGWSIDVQSEEHKGTAFRIKLENGMVTGKP